MTAWTLEDGLAVVRHLQAQLVPFGYHITLGGGVLNRGRSYKDLDLYVLPFGSDDPKQPEEVLSLLDATLGTRYPLGRITNQVDIDVLYPPQPCYVNGRFTYTPNGKRIDVFIA